MEGTLLVFWLPPGTSATEHGHFRRWCYGRNVRTWGGKYHYHLRGILNEIPSVQLYTGVVIVKKKDASRLMAFLRQNGARVASRRVILTMEDQGRLGLLADL